MPTAIRPARPDEAPRLSAIARAAKAHWGYPLEWLDAWRRDLAVTAAHVAGAEIYCAVEGDVVVGFYEVAREGEIWDLEHLWVDPPWMRRGIGAALLRHALDLLGRYGATALRIESDPHAEGFYLRLGARRVGEVPSVPPGRALPLLLLDVPRV